VKLLWCGLGSKLVIDKWSLLTSIWFWKDMKSSVVKSQTLSEGLCHIKFAERPLAPQKALWKINTRKSRE